MYITNSSQHQAELHKQKVLMAASDRDFHILHQYEGKIHFLDNQTCVHTSHSSDKDMTIPYGRCTNIRPTDER
jgi:hypothetical protein